jgi:hypothetical protein
MGLGTLAMRAQEEEIQHHLLGPSLADEKQFYIDRALNVLKGDLGVLGEL